MPKQAKEEQVDPDREFLSQYLIDKRVFAFYRLVFMPYRSSMKVM